MLCEWITPQQDVTEQQTGAGSQASDEPVMPRLDSLLSGINSRLALLRIGGNQKLFFKLLRDFVNDHGHDNEKLLHALDADDVTKAHRLVHTIRGVAGSIGAEKLEQKAEQLEQAIAREFPYSDLLQPFTSEFQTVMAQIDEMLQSDVIDQIKIPKKISDSSISWQEWSLKVDAMLVDGDPSVINCLDQAASHAEVAGLSNSLYLLRTKIINYDYDEGRKLLRELFLK
ncbi:hypothetical protein MNBD_GAMMA16-793 [hydrothermal vent metagenome]|uniref:HPt domain-containing protein n=1 Tax=hydrothermal vent metagenome TaxID=652676 RepID=A0A3B0ZEE5_9ZZZZ